MSEKENQLDAGKNYRWNPTDEITITGAEFDVLQRSISFVEAFMKAAALTRAEILKRMVDEGVAVEFEPEAVEPEDIPTELETVDAADEPPVDKKDL